MVSPLTTSMLVSYSGCMSQMTMNCTIYSNHFNTSRSQKQILTIRIIVASLAVLCRMASMNFKIAHNHNRHNTVISHAIRNMQTSTETWNKNLEENVFIETQNVSLSPKHSSISSSQESSSSQASISNESLHTSSQESYTTRKKERETIR